MKDCERYPHSEPDYQARAEEHERRAERRWRTFDNAWEAYQEGWMDQDPPIEPKPPAGERMQLDPGFSQSA